MLSNEQKETTSETLSKVLGQFKEVTDYAKGYLSLFFKKNKSQFSSIFWGKPIIPSNSIDIEDVNQKIQNTLDFLIISRQHRQKSF